VRDDRLILVWVETGGPPVSKPAAKGFGTRSVIASIQTQLGGTADFDWRPEGLISRLTVPLQGRQRAESDPAPHREIPAQTEQPVLNSRTA
jgi:two-component sensor histidine kinase